MVHKCEAGLWSGTVIWFVGFPQQEEAGYEIKVPLMFPLKLCKVDRIYVKRNQGRTGVRATAVAIQFVWFFNLLQCTQLEVQTVVDFKVIPFIGLNTVWKRLLKQHIIITFSASEENKFLYLKMNFEMLMFPFRGLLHCDLHGNYFSVFICIYGLFSFPKLPLWILFLCYVCFSCLNAL